MTKVRYSSPYLRFLGYLIDLMIGITLLSVGLYYISSSYYLTVFLDKTLPLLILLIYLGILSPIIEVLLTTYLGGSIGKLVTGIKVVNEKGSNLSLKKVLLRIFLGNVAASLFFFLGFIWIFVDGKRQGWHDMISGSFVVTQKRLFFITGIFALLALIIINVGLLSYATQNFALNSQMYSDTFTDIKNEFSPPEPETNN